MNWIARIRLMLAAMLIGLLVGCGGGGGAGGGGPYTIKLNVDRTLLPLNIAGDAPNIGGRYTATIYVDARDNGDRPIPGGDEVFGCAVTGGLDTGALYYLDGDPEHETTETIDGVEITTQNAYRSVVLDSNSGAASFHFHAGDTVGAVTIRCTVTEPTSNITRTAQATIQVGGTSTGKASQVVVDKANWNFPGYLFAQGVNSPNQGQMQVTIVDEAGQRVPNTTGTINNLRVRIVPDAATLAEDTATLRGVNKSGEGVAGPAIHISSINGQAQFTLVSGTNTGTVLLEFQADRSDNNVDNGIVEPIYNYAAVPVVFEVVTPPEPGDPLAITTTSLPAAQFGVPYGVALSGSGGVLPYTWSQVSVGLPAGLSISSSGVISGEPFENTSGSYNFVVGLTDASGTRTQQSFSIAYSGASVVPPTPTPTLVVTPSSATGAAGGTLNFVISGGASSYSAVSNNGAVATASTVTDKRFTATLVASGTTTIIVTDGSGQVAQTTITVTGTGGVTGPDPVIAPASIAVSECTTDIPFIIRGGIAPFTTFSTDSLNVTTTTPVKPTPTAAFYVFTVSTTAAHTATSYTVSVLDAQSRVATATVSIPLDTHSACTSYPKLTLSPTTIVSPAMRVGTAQVITIQGGGDANSNGSITFTSSTSDPSVVSNGAVTGPDSGGAYRFTVTANAVGTVIVSVRSEDGQNAYIPVVVEP